MDQKLESESNGLMYLSPQIPDTHEWDIHTPTVNGQKYWISNVRTTPRVYQCAFSPQQAVYTLGLTE